MDLLGLHHTCQCTFTAALILDNVRSMLSYYKYICNLQLLDMITYYVYMRFWDKLDTLMIFDNDTVNGKELHGTMSNARIAYFLQFYNIHTLHSLRYNSFCNLFHKKCYVTLMITVKRKWSWHLNFIALNPLYYVTYFLWLFSSKKSKKKLAFLNCEMNV